MCFLRSLWKPFSLLFLWQSSWSQSLNFFSFLRSFLLFGWLGLPQVTSFRPWPFFQTLLPILTLLPLSVDYTSPPCPCICAFCLCDDSFWDASRTAEERFLGRYGAPLIGASKNPIESDANLLAQVFIQCWLNASCSSKHQRNAGSWAPAEEFKENRGSWDASILFKSLVLSFLRACGKTAHAAALPPCQEKKATGQKFLLALSSCSTFILSTLRADGVSHGRVWGARRTCPAASAPSWGDAGIPELGTLLPAAPPASSAKNEIFHQLQKFPARGLRLILAICTQTLTYLIQESVWQPWGPAPSGVTEFVSFDNMGLMNRPPGTGNHFPRIAAK